MNRNSSIFDYLISVLKGMRVWQWPKNLIVFTIPLGITSTDFLLYQKIFFSFIGISFLASSVYFFNDIKDIELDKKHPTKKSRPIPSGEITIKGAYLVSIALAIIGSLLLAFLSTESFILGVAYLGLNILYTYKLKYTKILDILSISIMFVMRVLIASSSIQTPASYYLLGFIFFSSAGLAISKRLSVINDQSIQPSTEYKGLLEKLYNNNQLGSALNLASSLSVVTFLFWLRGLTNLNVFSLESISFVLTAILMTSILRKITILSKKGLLEDFIIGVLREKSLTGQILLSLILLILGLYV